MKSIRLTYLPKQKGGRLKNVDTFIQSCHLYKDAEWVMDDTLQSHEESINEGFFSFVGLSKQLLNTPCVIKLMMEQDFMTNKEIDAYQRFHKHPHPNIIQMICHFTCKDSPIRWKKRLTTPQTFCKIGEKTNMVVVVQAYIEGGDLEKNKRLTPSQWKSIVSQLSYACVQWYDMGFFYSDWNHGNVLIDTTPDATITYRIGRKKISILTEGLCPVLTDFGHSFWFINETLDKSNIHHLIDMLGMMWNLMRMVCPDERWKTRIYEEYMSVGSLKSKTAAMRSIKTLLESFDERDEKNRG
jgi:serine/threonine protein kinase